MICKTSLFNKGVLKSDLKRFWWMSMLYGLLLFFVLPLEHMLADTSISDKWLELSLQKSLMPTEGGSSFQALLICILPVALAALLFRYIMTSKSTAATHSIPCSRRTLYCSHFAAGVILLGIPVIFNGVTLMILQMTTALKAYYSLFDILRWMGLTLLFHAFFFSFAVFVGMFTGSSIAHIAFTYILNILPLGAYVLVQENLRRLLYGYSSNTYETVFGYYLPLVTLLDGRSEPLYFSANHILGYLLVIMVLFVAAGYVYEKRRLEAASDIIAFPIISYVFKYGVTVCCMLLGGAYFAGVSQGALSTLLFGYLISSFLGYWIAEMLMQKSFKVWHAYKGYVAYAAAVALILTVITTDVIGYAHRIPDPEEVESVYFGYDINLWTHLEKMKETEYRDVSREDLMLLKDDETIQNVVSLHSQLVQNPYDKNGGGSYIAYTLKNGKYLIRQYPIDEKQSAAALKPIYESMEYKRGRFPAVALKPENVKWLEIRDWRTPKKPAILADSSELREFLGLLQQEIEDMTFEEMITSSRTSVNIDIMGVNEKLTYQSLGKNYKVAQDWLKEKGYYENVVLLPNEIEYVDLKDGEAEWKRQMGQKTAQADSKCIEIRDQNIIEELLRLDEEVVYDHRKERVTVDFYIKGSPGYRQHTSFIYQDMPMSEELRSYLRQLQ